jgi:sulfate permease, SulP family
LSRERSRSSVAAAGGASPGVDDEAETDSDSALYTKQPYGGPNEFDQDDEDDEDGGDDETDGPSMLSNMLRRSPPASQLQTPHRCESENTAQSFPFEENDMASGALLTQIHSSLEPVPEVDEASPLLTRVNSKNDENGHRRNGYGTEDGRDVEAQKMMARKPFLSQVSHARRRVADTVARFSKVALDPRCWDRRKIWNAAVVTPVSTLPAVIVGLLLNILDALSYGML